MKLNRTSLIIVHIVLLSIMFIVGMNNNYFNLNKLLCLNCYENGMAFITLFFGAGTLSLMRLFYGHILNKYILSFLSLSVLALIFAPQYDDYFALNKVHSILAIYMVSLVTLVLNLLIDRKK